MQTVSLNPQMLSSIMWLHPVPDLIPFSQEKRKGQIRIPLGPSIKCGCHRRFSRNPNVLENILSSNRIPNFIKIRLSL